MGMYSEKAQKAGTGYEKYRDAHNVEPTATAYIERFEHKEPVEWRAERLKLFRILMDAVREGRAEGIDPGEMKEELKEYGVPDEYVIRAERYVIADEKREQEIEKMTEADRHELVNAIVIDINNQIEELPVMPDPHDASLATMKADIIKSQLEGGRAAGLSDRELISIGCAAGLDRGHCEDLVENGLCDDVEKPFYREEEDLENEYEEEHFIEHLLD